MTWPDELRREALALIERRAGARVPEIRWSDVEAAVEARLRSGEGGSVAEYLSRLSVLPDDHREWQSLISWIRVGESYFFRDPACLEALERHVLAPLVAERRARGLLFLRVWSAGCATGEEPYSVAMLLDRLIPDRSRWSLAIRGTDILGDALETARRGIYRGWSLRATAPDLRDRHFETWGRDAFALSSGIRDMVTFAAHNLAADGAPPAPEAGWDVILCRNVLMYFSAGARRAAVERLGRALAPGGWLVVAPAEGSAELMAPLEPVSLPGAVLYRKAAALPAPDLGGPLVPPAREEGAAPSWGALSVAPPAPSREDRLGAQATSAIAAAPGPEAQDAPGLARALADRGALDEAERLCRGALARDRSDLDAHLLLAAIADARGDEAGAAESLRRALYLDPDSAVAHLLLGSLLLRRGEAGRARQSLETAVRVLTATAPDARVRGAGDTAAAEILERARECLALAAARTGHG